MNKEFTHLDETGAARMVDVSQKQATHRTAIAEGTVYLNRETFDLLAKGETAKGDVLAAARIAGIQGAKHTWEMIPLCHQITLTGVKVDLTLCPETCTVHITAATKCCGETGVEMEALAAVSTAALTVYDMCKALQRDIRIGDIRLLEKTGGRSGTFRAED